MNKRGEKPLDLRRESLLPQEEMLAVETRKQEMVIGIPKEDPEKESRVPLTPEAVEILTWHGHRVVLESGAGEAANYPDNHYAESGAWITESREEVFQSDVVLKITPPALKEIAMMKERLTLISTFQIQIHKEKTYIERLMAKRITAVSMDRIRDENHCYPMIRSMSGIAGNTAVLIAGEYLSNVRGG
ncbi:MAG: alanine dehydrogenase, partial [Bacteroidales bacterium]|nr:alanine dehydrogenase [Bacteroidales bacterium]